MARITILILSTLLSVCDPGDTRREVGSAAPIVRDHMHACAIMNVLYNFTKRTCNWDKDGTSDDNIRCWNHTRFDHGYSEATASYWCQTPRTGSY